MILHDEFYNTFAKAVENWRRQNALFWQEMTQSAAEFQRSQINALKSLDNFTSSFKEIQDNFRDLSASMYPLKSTFEQNIFKAGQQIGDFLVSIKPFQEIAKQLQDDQRKWAQSLRASISAPFQLPEIVDALKHDVSLTTKSAILSQEAVLRINRQMIEGAVGFREPLYQTLSEMADSYRQIWDSFRLDRQIFFDVPSVVSKEPSIEMYLAIHQAETATMRAEALPAVQEYLTEVERSVGDMGELIASVDAKFLPMYHGAIDAISSKSVDKVRHTTTSLRELFTHVLHKLAPDDEFFKWNQNDTNLHNGRPTRRGRLLYICRKIHHGEFEAFIDRDISTALSFLDLCQQGTHAAERPFDEQQLKAIRIRMECLIYFIIKISKVA